LLPATIPTTRALPVASSWGVLGACARGEIVRGYPMRGTVFLMAAADARCGWWCSRASEAMVAVRPDGCATEELVRHAWPSLT